MPFFATVITCIVSYLLGGINGAIIVSTVFLREDIRTKGSGNAGLTNMYRSFGIRAAVMTLVIDVLKAAIGILIGWLWIGHATGFPLMGKLIAGLLVMLGHAFPIWYGLKGGKGALVCGVVALMVDWRVGLICIAFFIVVVIISSYVSAGSILSGAIVFPLFTRVFGATSQEFLLAALCGVLIVIMHIPNIGRIIMGKENKFRLQRKR
jgi:glycerol-3-phosphate acyltransferase PlsY